MSVIDIVGVREKAAEPSKEMEVSHFDIQHWLQNKIHFLTVERAFARRGILGNGYKVTQALQPGQEGNRLHDHHRAARLESLEEEREHLRDVDMMKDVITEDAIKALTHRRHGENVFDDEFYFVSHAVQYRPLLCNLNQFRAYVHRCHTKP